MTTISDVTAQALYDAVAHKGAHKGQLLAKAPPSRTMGYAAWQGAMLSCNPYKASIGGIMFMSVDQRKVMDEVTAIFDAVPKHVAINLDRDRKALETLGVW